MNTISDIIFGCGGLLLANPNVGDTASNWSSTLNMIGQFFFLSVIFVFIIFLAVYSLRFASRFRGYTGGNDNLRVVESRSLGGHNYIHIVKAGDKYFAVGSSKERVTFLTELDKSSITDVFDTEKRPAFEEMLAKKIGALLKKASPEDESVKREE